MAAPDQNTPVYVPTVEAVKWSINELRGSRIHPFFLAYLWLQKWAKEQGGTDDIATDWEAMGDFLRVAGGPPGKPYFRPFWHGAGDDPSRYWLNRNLAGSFAPSSIRAVPRKVVDVVDSHYALRPNHAALARENLLYGQPVSSIALAGYFYRDFGFVAPNGPPTVADLAAAFRSEFHWDSPYDDDAYSNLFEQHAATSNAGWFELLDADTVGVE